MIYSIKREMEMPKLNEPDIKGKEVCHNIPEAPGVYFITTFDGNVLYVGSSNCMRRRIAYLEAHVYDSSTGRFTHDASDPLLNLQSKGEEILVHLIFCDNYQAREKQLKQKYNPPWNKR